MGRTGCLRFGQFYALDRYRLARLVARVGVDRGDRIDDVHPIRDPAEDSVLAVEPGGGLGGDDEELAPVRVRAGVGHRQGASLDLVVVELILERVARAAGPGAGWVAALDHEVRDDAVEDHAVVEAVAGELAEVLDGLGRVVIEELNRDRAVIGVQGCVAHLGSPLSASSAAAWSKRSVAGWVLSHSASSPRPSSKSTCASNPRSSRARETSAKQCRMSPAREVPGSSGSMSFSSRRASVCAISSTEVEHPLPMLTASPSAPSLSRASRNARATSVTWTKSRRCSPSS